MGETKPLGRQKWRCLKSMAGWAFRFVLASLLALSGTILFLTTPAQAQITGSVPTATIGKPYTATFNQSSSCSGVWFGGATNLNAMVNQGLTVTPVSSTTVTVAGIPQGPNTGSWPITIDDWAGGCAPLTLTFTVVKPSLTLDTATLPMGEENSPYSGWVKASGSTPTFTYSLAGGMLPPGLGLSSSGLISGIPPPGSAGNYYFTVEVSDSTQPNLVTASPLTAQQSFFIVIERGHYTATVSIGTGLEADRTQVYIGGDAAGDLGGGESTNFLVPLGTSTTIRVDETVPHPSDGRTRFVAEDPEQMVSESHPSAHFAYYSEYLIELETDPRGIASLPGSGWHKPGATVKASAPDVVKPPGEEDTKYCFCEWREPSGAELKDQDLILTVQGPGSYVAKYETYYLLTLTSEYSDNQISWHLAGSQAEWNVASPRVRMSGLVGLFGGTRIAVNDSGTTRMDGPKEIPIEYKSHYTWAVILMSLAGVVIISGAYAAYRYGRQRPLARRPAAGRATQKLPAGAGRRKARPSVSRAVSRTEPKKPGRKRSQRVED